EKPSYNRVVHTGGNRSSREPTTTADWPPLGAALLLRHRAAKEKNRSGVEFGCRLSEFDSRPFLFPACNPTGRVRCPRSWQAASPTLLLIRVRHSWPWNWSPER